MSDAHRYAVFGGVLQTTLPLSLLPRVQAGDLTWTLHSRPGCDGAPFVGEQLGEAAVNSEIRVRLYLGPAGFSLQYDDTGRFDISADGRDITWYAPAEPCLDKAELDIAGRVLATALHASGTLCLHASGVEAGGGAIAFLAPKFHGKSTLAHALVAAGACLITDDVLPVELQAPVMVRPGIQRLRLWSDSASRLAARWVDSEGASSAKRVVDRFDDERLLQRPAPLHVIYLLAPMNPAVQREAAERHLVPVLRAGLSVLKNATLGNLLGKSEAPKLLDRAYAVAGQVPVYTLRYLRDLSRLDEVVDQILAWHGERPAREQPAVSQ